MKSASWVEVTAETNNFLAKGMNPSLLLQARGKIEQAALYSLDRVTNLGKRKALNPISSNFLCKVNFLPNQKYQDFIISSEILYNQNRYY